jgi:CheY-like chemotaxis protein
MNDEDFLDTVEKDIEHISSLFEDIISSATLNHNSKEEALNLIRNYRIIGQMIADNFMNGIQGSSFVRDLKFNSTLNVKVFHDNKRGV